MSAQRRQRRLRKVFGFLYNKFLLQTPFYRVNLGTKGTTKIMGQFLRKWWVGGCSLCLATFSARFCTTFTRSLYSTTASSRARQLTPPRHLCVYFTPSFLRHVVQSYSCMCPLITPCVVFILGGQPLALRCSVNFLCSARLLIVHKCIGCSHSVNC